MYVCPESVRRPGPANAHWSFCDGAARNSRNAAAQCELGLAEAAVQVSTIVRRQLLRPKSRAAARCPILPSRSSTRTHPPDTATRHLSRYHTPIAPLCASTPQHLAAMAKAWNMKSPAVRRIMQVRQRQREGVPAGSRGGNAHKSPPVPSPPPPVQEIRELHQEESTEFIAEAMEVRDDG